MVAAVVRREAIEISPERMELLRIARLHGALHIVELRGLRFLHHAPQVIEILVLEVPPPAIANGQPSIQPAELPSRGDHVLPQFDVLFHKGLHLFERGIAFQIVGLPFSQARSTLQLSRARACRLQDLHGKEPICIRIEIRVGVVAERTPLADILPLAERRGLQLRLVVVVTINKYLLIELTL